MSRMQARRLTVNSQKRDEDSKADHSTIVRLCAPFAAAILFMAQGSGPALAESNPVAGTFENSLKRQEDFGAGKLDFNKFFNKAKEAVEVTKDASDPSKAATEVPQKIPTFGKPVETSASVSRVAEDAKNKLDPSKVQQTVASGADKADSTAENVKQSVASAPGSFLIADVPGENAFRKTAKEGTKDNSGSALPNSNSQASAAPAYASKGEEASFAKIEQEQKKAEAGDPSKPRLDPSIVEGEPEPGPAPGTPNKLPEQPKPEPETPGQLGTDSAGGKVQETKRGSGPLDLFGGGKTDESPASKADSLVQKAEEPNSGNLLDFFSKGLGGTSALPQDRSNNVGTLAALDAPQPSAIDEKAPESAPGEENTLPEQPAPEPTPASALGTDTPGGETQDTKSGSGPLDLFGGSNSGDSDKAAEKNIQKATAFELGNGKSSEVAQIAEEEVAGPDEGKATLIGVFFSIALEIAIFSTYKSPEGHGSHH